MNWYIAKLVFQVISGEGFHTPQFDEQWRLIKADEVAWAHEKARVLGWLEQGCFDDERQRKVEWSFIEVAEIQQVTTMEDGAQLYSTTEEPIDAIAYLEMIRRKAQKSLALARNSEQGLLMRV
ncbi:MAG TPA: DUF4288 domain-containing protein [Cyclobacteriaceae bacterium]|nr:DUF4288 domain-containing protein [Cyclobacteriaceae bacterium]